MEGIGSVLSRKKVILQRREDDMKADCMMLTSLDSVDALGDLDAGFHGDCGEC